MVRSVRDLQDLGHVEDLLIGDVGWVVRLGRPGYWLTSNQARKIKRAQEYLRQEGGSQPPG